MSMIFTLIIPDDEPYGMINTPLTGVFPRDGFATADPVNTTLQSITCSIACGVVVLMSTFPCWADKCNETNRVTYYEAKTFS